MKKFYGFTFVAFIFFFTHAKGQVSHGPGLLNFELYGGPSISYFDVDIQNAHSDMSLFSPIDAHLGINVLTRVTDAWQVSLQAEYLRRPVGAKETNLNGETISRRSSAFDNRFGNYSIGARYNIYQGNKAYFFQPSVGLAVNNVAGDFYSGASSSTRTGLTLRVETGVKFYNRRNNYFILGIRHQQGLNRLDQQHFPGTPSYPRSMDFTSKGSFTGLFVGYGINTGKK